MHNNAQLRRALGEITSGRLQPLLDLMADGVIWEQMDEDSEARTTIGKTDVAADRFHNADGALPRRFVYEIDRVEGNGDVVVAQLSGRYDDRGDRDYVYRYCWIFRFTAGEVTEVREYTALEYLN